MINLISAFDEAEGCLTERKVKDLLARWYAGNAKDIPAELTIKDFFEVALEKGWLVPQPDGTFLVDTRTPFGVQSETN